MAKSTSLRPSEPSKSPPTSSPETITLAPEDYELPSSIPESYRILKTKQKQPVTITKKQIEYFGERGCPWADIEAFYNVSRVTLLRWFREDYERGRANVNTTLRSKMLELAFAGNPTMLIWLAKNRLNMSDQGEITDDKKAETGIQFVANIIQGQVIEKDTE